MIVRNWMLRDPITVASDTLLLKAKRILLEKNLRALPVVDDGRLRGLITRAQCLRASEFVARTEDPHEFAYFANRLKVKDLMVRKPHTVDIDDTIEVCLRRGQKAQIGQFPVLENGKVVGLISSSEILYLAAQMVGTTRRQNGLTIGPLDIQRGSLTHIVDVIENAGAVMESVISVPSYKDDGKMKVILRFCGIDAKRAAAVVKKNGYQVLEVCPYVESSTEEDRKLIAHA